MKIRKVMRGLGQRHFEDIFEDVYKAFRGGISFGRSNGVIVVGDNIDGTWVTVQAPALPNTEFTVPHSLKRVPVGYDIKRLDSNGVIYDGVTSWSTNAIYLRCSVANAKITLFVH